MRDDALSWLATRLLVATTFAGSVSIVAGQPRLDLQALTVPSDRLSPGCRLKTSGPRERVLLGSQNPVVVTGESDRPVPSNPWSGTDRRIATTVRRLIDGEPPLPDGPPLDADQMAAFALRWADDVDEAYVATYLGGDDSTIDVYAVRFSDVKRATPTPPAGTTPVVRATTTSRLVIGATVALVVAAKPSDCFEAISDHLRSLR